MILTEYLMRQVGRLSFQTAVDFVDFRNSRNIVYRLFCRNAEDIQQQGSITFSSRFIDAQTHVTVVKIAQVDILAQGNGAYFLRRNVRRQAQAQGVKISLILLYVSQFRELRFQPESQTVDVACDASDTLCSVIHRITSGHGGQQSLCRTDIRSCLFAFDMLFTCLQGHAVAQVSVFVFRQTDDTSRHVPLELIACRKICSRRTSVEHRCTHSLAASEYDVSSPFSRRSQQCQTQNVCVYSHLASGSVCLLGKFPVILDASAVVRVLDDASENVRSKFQRLIVSGLDLYALRDGPGADDSLHLRKDLVVDEQRAGIGFLLAPASERIHHGSRFGSRRRFIQQRTVGQRHACQVTDGCLKVQQRFQASL